MGMLPRILGKVKFGGVGVRIDSETGCLIDENRQFLLMMAKPIRPAQDLSFDRELVDGLGKRVEAVNQEWRTDGMGSPPPRVEFTGGYMVALDDADAHNGCFRVIRASHTRGLLPGLEGDGTLGPLFTDPRYFDESAEVLAVVPAGSLVFFSPHTVHGSQPNLSDAPRRAMVLTYQPGGRRMFKVDAKRDAGTGKN